ncbi:MAG: glycosyltransferase [Oscillatoriales cyanobacterium C42_A2020_001]|nr:glycosyltransferase [Leptolyngbyaceae cyanobacterium C42_A2020_001]
MKVALVHDYLREYGDAERTLQTLHRLYPNAPIYTAFVDRQRLGKAIQHLTTWDIRPTFAQRLPGICHFYQFYQHWLPYFWESLNLSEYDLVISLSGNYMSQAVLTRSPTLHISYCYTPPRQIWEPLPPSSRPQFKAWAHPTLRQYDFYAAQRVDRFVTNSETTARRIRKFYRRSAEVIYPPVQVRGAGSAGTEYYLYVGQMNSLQQVDLAIQACQQINRPLWVVGTGSEATRLQQAAGKSVHFLGEVPAEAMAEIYEGAIALIYPTAYEDFALPPVEAMGHGVPVIASEQSGMRDIILNFRTGLLFSQPTVEGLCEAILQFEKLRFSAIACIERAEEFAESVFISKFEWFVAKALDDH